MENLPEHLGGLALPAHLALQDAEKSNDLRKKLEAAGEPRVLHTRRGQGYILTAPDQP